MRTISHLSAAFLLSLTFVGVSIYYFIEGNALSGKIFVFAAIFAFLTLFIIFRSLYYLRHKATFNEIFYVMLVPLIPIVLILAQTLFEIYAYPPFRISTGQFTTDQINYVFYINIMDILLLPYYIFSNFLLFRTFVRYPFIRFKGTSEKGIPPKFFGFLMIIIIPATYLLTSILYFENLFLLIFGITYFYSGLLTLFV